MEEIFTYIENSDDCQFTLDELKNISKHSAVDNRTIKTRLKLRYGDKIIITEKAGTSTFICFIDDHHDILNKAWYEKNIFNEKEERFRILEAAAVIIREDIQSAVDASDSRVKKDAKDIQKLLEWFSSHDPFPEVNKIVSIASGVVGDDNINCHRAREVGIASMSKITGQMFNNLKLKRADKVLPLLAMSSTIKVHDEKVPVDPEPRPFFLSSLTISATA